MTKAETLPCGLHTGAKPCTPAADHRVLAAVKARSQSGRPDSVPLSRVSAHLLVGEISTDRIHILLYVLMLWCLMQASQLMQLFLKPNAGLLHGHASASAPAEQSGMAGGDWGDAGDGFGGDNGDDGMEGGHDSSCKPLPVYSNCDDTLHVNSLGFKPASLKVL